MVDANGMPSDPHNPSQPDWNNPVGTTWGLPTCSMLPIQTPYYNNAAELTTYSNPDRAGQSCGHYTYISVSVHCVSTSPGADATVHMDGNYGSLEAGWMRGAKISAAVCYEKQLENEINSKTIQVHQACEGPAHDLKNLVAASNSLESYMVSQCKDSSCNADSVREALQDARGCGTVDSNGNYVAPTASSSNPTDNSRPKQSACYIQQGRIGIEALFKKVLMCEFAVRLDRGYDAIFGIPAQADLKNQFNQIGNDVSNECQNELGNDCSDSDATDCANSHYQPKARKLIEDRIQQYFPTNGSCGASLDRPSNTRFAGGAPLPFGFIGSLGAIAFPAGIRRRKKGKQKKSGLRSASRVAFATAIMLAGYLSSGCGGGASVAGPTCTAKDGTPIYSDSDPSKNLEALCCDGATEKDPPPDPKCPGFQPGGGGGGGTPPPPAKDLNGAAPVATMAGANLEQAAALIGDKNTMGMLANTAAATAGGIAKNGKKTDSGAANNGGSNLDGNGAGGGGGGGGANANGGGGMGPGDLTTAAIPDDTSSDTPAPEEGATYGGGGGAGGGGGGAAGGGMGGFNLAGLFGGAKGGAGGGPNGGTIDFGAQNDGVAPIGSGKDASDYFSRIGVGENLFKIVTRKYQQKTTDWIHKDMESGLSSAAKSLLKKQ